MTLDNHVVVLLLFAHVQLRVVIKICFLRHSRAFLFFVWTVGCENS